MKLFFRYLKIYKKEAFLAPLFKLLEACFDLLVPVVVAYMIDYGIGSVSGVADKSIVFKMFPLLILLGVVGLSCTLVAQYFSARAAVGCAAVLRHDLFAHMQRFSYADTDRVGTSAMVTRITSDVNQVQSGINMTLRLLLRSPIIVFGAVIMAFTVNASLAWIFAVAVPLLAVIVFSIMLAGMPLYKKIQGKLDEVTAKTRSTLEGVRVVRAFGMEERQTESFRETNDSHTRLQKFTGRITALMNPLTFVVVNGALVAIIYFGGLRAEVGGATQGEIIALTNYMSQILVELIKLANTIFTVTKAAACANRIDAVLQSEVGQESIPSDAAEDPSVAVRFDNVSLTYPNAAAPALSHISLSVPAGQTVGIIGGTGSGKSTLVNMIPRFYDATEGTVYVFGKPVCSYPIDRLRGIVGIVPQKAVLFRGTIRSNLQWGKADATDDEIWEALRLAQAEEFVRKKEGCLDAPVEQGGHNFSGGQKQRLTIARALVGKPPILILDDSASALDFATDARLRHALRSLDYHPTVFIISQRTSSIHAADQILVLEDGETAGRGTHEELLSACPVYREIHESQFKGGETA